MTLIGEQGFIGVPEVDVSAVELFKRKTEDEIGTYMDSLVPIGSIFFSADGHGEDLTYTFSASAQYHSPDNPEVVVSAFMTRDINGEVVLHTYSTPSTDLAEVTSLEDALCLNPGIRIRAERRRAREGGWTFELRQERLMEPEEWYRPGGALECAESMEQHESIYGSILETLKLIEAANTEAYGTPQPRFAGYDGRPSIAELAGYVLVPVGKANPDGSHSRSRYFLRSELGAELLEALDARRIT